MQITDIRINEIEVTDRIRPLNPDWVAALKESIQNLGLLNPISVYARTDGTMVLGAGAHRLQAARELGWEVMPATLVCGADIDRELAEIDENLCRSELSPAQRAIHYTRRKELWIAKRDLDRVKNSPSATQGIVMPASELGDPNSVTQLDVNVRPTQRTTELDARGQHKSPQQLSGFAASIATIAGDSKTKVNLHIQRGAKLGGATLRGITGTSLDKGVELDALVKLESVERAELAARAKAGENVSARKVLETKSQSPKTRNKGLAKNAVSALEKCASAMDEREFSAALKGVVVSETIAHMAYVIGSCAGGESELGDAG